MAIPCGIACQHSWDPGNTLSLYLRSKDVNWKVGFGVSLMGAWTEVDDVA